MSDSTDRSAAESTPNREEELKQGAEKDADVEAHFLKSGPEKDADVDALKSGAEGIRPDDGPEGEVEGHFLKSGAEGIRPLGEHEAEEPEVEGHRIYTNAERLSYEAERIRP